MSLSLYIQIVFCLQTNEQTNNQTIKQPEYECSNKCKNQTHAMELGPFFSHVQRWAKMPMSSFIIIYGLGWVYLKRIKD